MSELYPSKPKTRVTVSLSPRAMDALEHLVDLSYGEGRSYSIEAAILSMAYDLEFSPQPGT